jgi:hypothetical protein
MEGTMKEWKLVVAGGLIGMLGMGAGAWVFGSRPVEAQEQAPQVQWRECFFAEQEAVDVNDQSVVATPSANRLIRVPSGWTVVSSGGSSRESVVGTVMFCRP